MRSRWKASATSSNPDEAFQSGALLQEAAALLGTTLSDEEAEARVAKATEGFWGTPEEHIEQFLEHPIFDGPYSNDCYVGRVSEALHAHQKLSGHWVLRDWEAMVFHLPLCLPRPPDVGPKLPSSSCVRQSACTKLKRPSGQTEEEAGGASYLAKLWSKTPHYKASMLRAYITPGELASQQIGNMYTGSIFYGALEHLGRRPEFETSISQGAA